MTTKELVKDPLNLIITGVGGQGNVMISLIIGNALVKEGYLVTIGETYGASQRGGPVMSHLRISKETQCSPLIPDGHAHIILGMEPVETLRMLLKFGNPDIVTIINPRPIYPMDIADGQTKYPDFDNLMQTVQTLSRKTWIINATEEAQKMGNPIFANVILIGALMASEVLPLDQKSIEQVLRETFPTEIGVNMAAYQKGIELLRQQPMKKRL